MPLVSVVMLSYNHEKFLPEAIESVLNQDFDNFELIIVDDASTDSSRHIIQEYAEKDARVRVILHKKNCGIAKTANDGFAAATGKFLADIASDDLWMKEKLSTQLAVLESNDDLVVWSEGEVIDEMGKPIGSSFSGRTGGNVSRRKSGDIFRELSHDGGLIFQSTVLVKRANLNGMRFDESLVYANDWKFYLDLAAKYEFYYIPEPLARYRIHPSNAWGVKGPEGPNWRIGCQDQILVRQYLLKRYPHLMSAEDKAIELERIGRLYFALGQNKEAVMYFFRAFACAPLRRSNLQYPQRFLRLTRRVLTPKSSYRHPDS